MKAYFVLFFIFFSYVLLGQTGPGGVGNNQGTSDLKLWFRPDNGINVSGTSVDSWINSAGISALDISETGAQRPTLVTGAVNGFSEVSYSGSNRLRTGTTLTTSNFVTDQASSFVVCRADNTSQTSCVYTTDPLVGSTRFANHIPWSNTVYFDIGTCCSNDARIQVGGLTGLTAYSIWTYDASPALGKQLYRNGTLLQSRPNTLTYNSHATHRFNIGGNTSGTNGFAGDVAEIIIYNVRINSAQRIIINNYLAAKFGLALAAEDVFTQDEPGNGNFDFDVAGIGRVDASNIHDDAQGTGIVRILSPSNLGNNEFLMWGHNNGELQASNTIDVPPGVQARFERVWRVSEVNSSGGGVNVGDINMRWDLNGLGSITATDLRLLIDDDNDGTFNDETPISGAVDLGGGIYEFQGVPGGAGGIRNNRRFTLGTINTTQTPLPIELVYFNAFPTEDRDVKLEWQTASEINNDFFSVERSQNGFSWESISFIDGAGNSNHILNYSSIDDQPIPGNSYYRLKQTDFNGDFKYSDIRRVYLNTTNSSSIVVYPNPAVNWINVTGNKDELSELRMFNSLGQEVTSLLNTEQEEEGSLTLDLSKLSKGIYTLKTRTATAKILLQ